MPDSFSDYKKVFNIDVSLQIYAILLRPEVQQEIIEFNQSQLTDGVDSNNERIISISAEEQGQGNVYSVYTIASRNEKGLQTSNVDLKDTGRFWSTFAIKVSKDSFEVIADFNSPGEDIRDNFDSSYDFLGLADSNLESFTWLIIYRELEKSVPVILEEKARRYLN